MTENSNQIQINWDDMSFDESCLDFVFDFLFEKEMPMTPFDLAKAIIQEKIRVYKKEIAKQEKSQGLLYRPKEKYRIGEEVTFPLLNNLKGKVIEIRQGNNPDIPIFSVASFQMEDGSVRQFVSEYEDHSLNTFDYSSLYSSTLTDPIAVYKKYGKKIAAKIQKLLSQNGSLISIANYWFPKALLIDINPGYLNLAEAVLEMEEGKPVHTKKILELIEYPVDSNDQLTEFSFNYALHSDDRFDEVGPIGTVLWTLKLLEPEDVRKVPLTLKCYDDFHIENHGSPSYSFDQLRIHDELDTTSNDAPEDDIDYFDVCINYPHWKAGTIPLIKKIHSIFPTALETDRVIFNFIDAKTKESFPGWVIIPEKYVCGLKTWYREYSVIPGSIIRISKTEKIDEVIVSLIPPRASRDWIRTALFDQKGRIYFETKHQSISTKFDERMCIFIENSPQLDIVWEQNNKNGINLHRLIGNIFKDLSRSNPQGIVHFQEIYAGLNMMHRCPPQPLLDILMNDDQFVALDDLNFKLNVKAAEDEA